MALTRIIVAYDGSDLAGEAFAFALTLAKAARVPIVGLHAVEPEPLPPIVGDPMLALDPTPVGPTAQELADARREKADRGRRLLGELAERCSREGVAFEQRLADGLLLDVLVELAAATDLIVVGKKGRFRRSGIGSSTRSLVHKAPCAVAVVSERAGPIAGVLAVVDETKEGKRAVALGSEVSAQTGWPLRVAAAAGRDETEDAARARASALAPGAEVVTWAAGDRTEARLAVEASAPAGRRVVVMGAYAESWLHELLFGASASDVLRRVGAPVILAR